MARNKMFYVDEKLIEMLEKEQNQSFVVNKALEEFYRARTNPTEGWTKEMLDLEDKRLELLENAMKIQNRLIRLGAKELLWRLSEDGRS